MNWAHQFLVDREWVFIIPFNTMISYWNSINIFWHIKTFLDYTSPPNKKAAQMCTCVSVYFFMSDASRLCRDPNIIICIWYALACGNTCMFFHVVICSKWITHVREVCALHRIVSCLQTAGTTRHLFTAVWSDIHWNLNQLITADIESCFQLSLVYMNFHHSFVLVKPTGNTQMLRGHDWSLLQKSYQCG